ncbi:hypothetical protein ACWCOP_13580 [Maricaulaceae bacterium MS644]
MSKFFNARTALAGFAAAAALNAGAQADQVFADDLIVQGSFCVGTDCVNNENFGFDTIRLKENNTRIAFDDTSNSGSFPNVDWELQANESANGGQNRFAFIDRTNGRTIFVMEAASPNNSLYIDSTGNIGMGTSTPALPLHVVDGNSPALRLEQDGSSGFTAQTWDIAGNEANFFVRDVTNGSRLPFKIVPNAPTNSLYVAASGDVGMGTQSPAAGMHIQRSTGGFASMLRMQNDGPMAMIMDNNGSNAVEWRMGMGLTGTELLLVSPDGPGEEFALTTSGDLRILGNFISGGQTLTVPDYVFEADYDLRTLAEVQAFIEENGHLPNVPSAADIAENGVNLSEMQMLLLEKVEELTLYTLAQQEQIDAMSVELASVRQ